MDPVSLVLFALLHAEDVRDHADLARLPPLPHICLYHEAAKAHVAHLRHRACTAGGWHAEQLEPAIWEAERHRVFWEALEWAVKCPTWRRQGLADARALLGEPWWGAGIWPGPGPTR